MIQSRRKIFIKNPTKHKGRSKKALLYYMTDPFWRPSVLKKYSHTNFWEITEMVRIMNSIGYNVDVIDRNLTKKHLDCLKDEYDLFIGNATGNSGKFYPQIAKKLNKAKKILYATASNPLVVFERQKKRLKYFKKRHPNSQVKMTRSPDKLNFQDVINLTDAIFLFGHKKSLTSESFKSFKKSIFYVNPSTSPRINVSIHTFLKYKDVNKFLFFSGNGLLHKGLDIVLDFFLERPDLQLYVRSPLVDSDFVEHYRDALFNTKNIKTIGHLDLGGEQFENLTNKCTFLLSPSCSEGMSTAILTGMRRGLIPIITPETGIGIESGAEYINGDIDSLRLKIEEVLEYDNAKINRLAVQCLKYSQNFLQENFSISFRKALLDYLEE